MGGRIALMDKRRKAGSTGSPLPNKDRTAHSAKRNMKQREGKLSNLSYADLTADEFALAVDAIRKETDRGAAIIGCAIVEEALTAALLVEIVNRDVLDAAFRDDGGPFSTMARKTVAAYALGLCSKTTRGDVDTVRAVRNQFSHALLHISFLTPEIVEACSKLSAYPQAYAAAHPTEARERYENACFGAAFALSRAATLKLQSKTIELRNLIATGGEGGSQNAFRNFRLD
jgi:hypothetical protein